MQSAPTSISPGEELHHGVAQELQPFVVIDPEDLKTDEREHKPASDAAAVLPVSPCISPETSLLPRYSSFSHQRACWAP